MLVAFHLSYDICNQEEYRHEKNAYRNSYPNETDDFASNCVD